MRQINANIIIIPSLAIEETLLRKLLTPRLVHEGSKTHTPPCCPQHQWWYPPLGSLTRGWGGASEQAYLREEDGVTCKCEACKMCLGEVWNSIAPVFLSIHCLQTGLSPKSEKKWRRWNYPTRDSRRGYSNVIVTFLGSRRDLTQISGGLLLYSQKEEDSWKQGSVTVFRSWWRRRRSVTELLITTAPLSSLTGGGILEHQCVAVHCNTGKF